MLVCEGLRPTEEREGQKIRQKVSHVSGNEANREKEKEQDKSLDIYNHLELLFCKVHYILKCTYFSSLAIFS